MGRPLDKLNALARVLGTIERAIIDAVRSSPVALAIGRALSWISELGIQGYPPEDRRRLKILNMIAALIAATTAIYAVQQSMMNYAVYKPIILINLGLLAMALMVPLLHRLGPVAAGLFIVVCEYAALVALSAYLGRSSGLHLQYFVTAAAPFLVLGPERVRLILAIAVVGVLLHIYVWFSFPPEVALIQPDEGLVNGIYVQAAITTGALISATVWYAFRLVEQAQAETERLLRNILPADVVDRLKSKPDAAIADSFEDASVLFADISGFVPLARRLGAPRVVELLNELVSEFDRLAARHGVEKIKTIGDAYMAAAGLPVRADDHIERLARMALAMQGAIDRLNAETGLDVRIRIGMAAGPLMAGVIGKQKFSYDVWGDTVNLAARLESLSAPGRILVCPHCRSRLEGLFEFEPRGLIEVKGLGPRETWFVVAPRPVQEAG